MPLEVMSALNPYPVTSIACGSMTVLEFDAKVAEPAS
jgi:hypothetical protein